MQKARAVTVGTLFAVAMVLAAAAEPAAGQPAWPDHSAAYLGVQIVTVNQDQATSLRLKNPSGALVVYVDQDGPACRAGVLQNDVVIGFNGSKIDSAEQLTGLIHGSAPNKPITLTIYRGGMQQDINVKLGSWTVSPHARTPAGAMAMLPPMPPRAFVPDAEIPSMTLLSGRHGLLVESLTPQLADFFGVPHGQGVLVRSVEQGSPAAAAGMKAGDIVLKVNNETLHDISDWQRTMQTPNSRLTLGVWRDKRAQTVVMNLPGGGNTSRLQDDDWLSFDTEAQNLGDEMESMRPQIEEGEEEIAQLGPSDKDMQQMQRELEKSMKRQKKDMEKMARDMAKAAKPMAKDADKMQRDLSKSLPSQQDIEAMQEQLRKSLPNAQQVDEMKREVEANLPTQQQMEDMRRQIEDSMKNWTPQMQELQKQMEQHKLDLQQMMKGFNCDCQV